MKLRATHLLGLRRVLILRLLFLVESFGRRQSAHLAQLRHFRLLGLRRFGIGRGNHLHTNVERIAELAEQAVSVNRQLEAVDAVGTLTDVEFVDRQRDRDLHQLAWLRRRDVDLAKRTRKYKVMPSRTYVMHSRSSDCQERNK